MTWTYDGLPSTNSSAGKRDAVRSMIRDTVATRALFADEELAFYISQEGNLFRAAAACCDALASDVTFTRRTVGDLSVDGAALADKYRLMAKAYRRRAGEQAMPYAGGISISDKDLQRMNTDLVTPFFTRTRQDYPGLFSPSTGSSS